MQLDQETVELFLAVVPAFIASLPPAPSREEPLSALTINEHRAALEIQTALINLGVEVRLLLETFPKDRARCELSETHHAKATQAFDDLLFALGELLDDALDNTGCHSSGSQKLVLLRDQLATSITTIASETTASRITVQYFRRNKGAEAVQYRHNTIVPKQFNEKLAQIFATEQVEYSVSMGGDLPDRLDLGSEERDRDLIAYKKQSVITNTMVKVILERHEACHGHPTYINVSADNLDRAETSIETIMAQCNVGIRRKWYYIHWISSYSGDTLQDQLDPPQRICSKLRLPRRNRPLFFKVASDGSWQEVRHDREDSGLGRQVKPPEIRLADVFKVQQCPEDPLKVQQCSEALASVGNKLRASKWHRFGLGLRIARSILCLVGSPLIRSRWKANNLLVPKDTDADTDNTPIKIYMNDVSNLKVEADRRHIVLDIGVLLWELFLMRPVVPRSDDEDDDEDITMFNALNREHSDREDADFLEPAQLQVIENCLNMYEQVKELKDEEFRTEVYDKIVSPLKKYARPFSEVPTPKAKALPQRAQTQQVALSCIPEESNTHSIDSMVTLEIGSDRPAHRRRSSGALQEYLPNIRHQGGSYLSGSGLTSLQSRIPRTHAVASTPQNDLVSASQIEKTHDSRYVVSQETGADNGFRELTSVFTTVVEREELQQSVVSHTNQVVNSVQHSSGSLFDSQIISDPQTIRAAKNWLETLQHRVCQRVEALRKAKDAAVRVAVLDTGIVESHPEIQKNLALNGSTIKQCQDWSGSSRGVHDVVGHGTAVCDILLQFAKVDLFVGKVSDKAEFDDETPSYIAKAIEHATWIEGWHAHIVVLSLGFDREDDDIRNAIEQAYRQGVIILAAASNSGSLYPDRRVAYPARMHGHVLSIRSATGQSKRSDASPNPSAGEDNFMILGEGIEAASVRSPTGTEFFSGTSFATPVAACVASLVLEYSFQRNGRMPNVDKNSQKKLWSYRGIRKVFRYMCGVDDQVQASCCCMISPWRLFDEDKEDRKVGEDIEWLMKKL